MNLVVLFMSSFLLLWINEVTITDAEGPNTTIPHQLSSSHVTAEASTYEELCDALNNATVTQVVVTSLIRFDAACTVQLLHRGTVQLSCMKSDDYAHLHCPKSLFCLKIINTPAAESYNSTLAIHGCSIVGGGFLRIEEAPINITIDTCRYTTNNAVTSSGFLRYEVQHAHTPYVALLIQILNTIMLNMRFSLFANCARVFILRTPQDKSDKDQVRVVMSNVTTTNSISTSTLFMVGFSEDDKLSPRLISVSFSDMTLRNLSISFAWAVGGMFLHRVTGTFNGVQCLQCNAQRNTQQYSMSAFLALQFGVHVNIDSIVCTQCSADEASALLLSDCSNTTITNMTVAWSQARGALRVRDNVRVDVTYMNVQHSEGVLAAGTSSYTTIQNLSVYNTTRGIYMDNDASLDLNDCRYLDVSGFEMYGSSSARIQQLTIRNASAKQPAFTVGANTELVISSLTIENVTSSMDGGVFAVYDDASLRVDELSVINSTTLHGSGGVLYCNTRKVCELGGVTSIQGAVSREWYGGILSTGPICGNVSLTCKQGGMI
eukprot:PhF_6_TR9234/c1_g1_i9/m.14582